jgi:hypothetical protein
MKLGNKIELFHQSDSFFIDEIKQIVRSDRLKKVAYHQVKVGSNVIAFGLQC